MLIMFHFFTWLLKLETALFLYEMIITRFGRLTKWLRISDILPTYGFLLSNYST